MKLPPPIAAVAVFEPDCSFAAPVGTPEYVQVTDPFTPPLLAGMTRAAGSAAAGQMIVTAPPVESASVRLTVIDAFGLGFATVMLPLTRKSEYPIVWSTSMS